MWQKIAVPAVVVLVPLMLVALHHSAGSSLYGASRWIDLGYLTLQPSEFMKLAIVAFAATVLTKKWGTLDDPVHLLIPLAPVVLGGLLVILQRDLGTTVIICGSVFLLMFAAGIRLRYLAVTGAVALAGAAFLIFGEAYRRTRFIDAFLNPWNDPDGAGFQLIQGMIAFGSGGWTGVGLGASRQKWDYLPNAHSDFIFAIIGEELGLLGALFVLAMFAVLLFAGVRHRDRRAGHLRAPDGRRHHRMDRAADDHQPGGGHRADADHGRAAAAAVVRRHRARRHAHRDRGPRRRRPRERPGVPRSAPRAHPAHAAARRRVARRPPLVRGERPPASTPLGNGHPDEGRDERRRYLRPCLPRPRGGRATARPRTRRPLRRFRVRAGSHPRPGAGFPFVPVRVASAQTRISLHTAKALWMSFTAASAVRPLVRAADVVVGIGGYASAPAILAARRVRTPIVLIEQNGVPGIVNRVAARWAGAVATTFEATAERLPPGIRVVRQPRSAPDRRGRVRTRRSPGRSAPRVRTRHRPPHRVRVRREPGGPPARPHGRDSVGELARHDLQLLVSTGAAHEGEVAPAAEASGDLLVRVEGFIERMDLALAATDLAVARAGSGTISELAVCGVPSLLVPYPYATEHHQEANGREVERAGGAEVVLEAELTPTVLARRVTALIDDEPRRAAMSRAMLAWARPDADERIADLVAEVAA